MGPEIQRTWNFQPPLTGPALLAPLPSPALAWKACSIVCPTPESAYENASALHKQLEPPASGSEIA